MSVRAPWLRAAVTIVLIGGVIVALRAAATDARSVDWPGATAVAAAVGLVVITHVGGALSWLILFEGRGGRTHLACAYFVGQLGKYVPGGLVQVAALYDQARRAGVGHDDVAVRLPMHALVATVIPCGFAGLVLAATGYELPPLVRIALAAGASAALLVLLRSKWLAWGLDLAHSRWARIPAGDTLPPRHVLLKTAVVGSLGVAAHGAAAAVLLGQTGWRDFAVAASGFTVAFVIGFLALPFPSGLGVREAAFVGLLESVAPVADLLAISIAIRVVQLSVEVTIAGPLVLASRRSRSVSDSPEPLSQS